MKLFLSMSHAASALNMSVRHFRRIYIEKNNGPYIQIRRGFFVETRKLIEWAKAHGYEVQL